MTPPLLDAREERGVASLCALPHLRGGPAGSFSGFVDADDRPLLLSGAEENPVEYGVGWIRP